MRQSAKRSQPSIIATTAAKMSARRKRSSRIALAPMRRERLILVAEQVVEAQVGAAIDQLRQDVL